MRLTRRVKAKNAITLELKQIKIQINFNLTSCHFAAELSGARNPKPCSIKTTTLIKPYKKVYYSKVLTKNILYMLKCIYEQKRNRNQFWKQY